MSSGRGKRPLLIAGICKTPVVPAQGDPVAYDERRWIPAFAGTTEYMVA
jgi:hypothetical protein